MGNLFMMKYYWHSNQYYWDITQYRAVVVALDGRNEMSLNHWGFMRSQFICSIFLIYGLTTFLLSFFHDVCVMQTCSSDGLLSSTEKLENLLIGGALNRRQTEASTQIIEGCSHTGIQTTTAKGACRSVASRSRFAYRGMIGLIREFGNQHIKMLFVQMLCSHDPL